MERPDITITRDDHDRLLKLLGAPSDTFDEDVVSLLRAELARARTLPREEIPHDVVTMNSRFTYFVETTGVERTITLVYPEDEDFGAGKESVLNTIGSAVLGLAVGQVIEWPRPGDGKTLRIALTEILYQPEAEGDVDV